MSNIPITSLPVAIALDGSEAVAIVQGGTTKRTTVQSIADIAAGFVPLARNINTQASGGLAGGGSLENDLYLTFAPVGLTSKAAMTVADAFAINDVAAGNIPAKSTFPNAMKALTGLPALSIPNLLTDYLVINRAADGLTYKINPSSLSLAAGNIPAGGLTGQFLAKLSNADYDTEWANPSILLDAFTIAANPTGIQDFAIPVTLGATLGFTGTTLQTKVGTGDVSWPVNSFVTTIGANKVTDGMLRQSAALSVIGNATNALADVADISAASDYQILRRSGTAIGFGSINLAQSGAVGSSILAGTNGGTGVNNGVKTITLGGNLTTSGAFNSTFTMTGATSVTFPTSGTLATTAGAAIPSVAQGDLLYGSAVNVLSALAKDANATRYLSNTGASNNPAWAQIALATGVSGLLPLANGGLNANLTASNGGIFYSTASAGAILSGTATANQVLLSGSSAAPAWSTATYPATTTINQILYSSSANVIAGLATANGGILNTSITGVPSVTPTPVLGVAGTTAGTIGFRNATSGTITVSPVAGALGAVTLTLPAATDTFAVLAASQALTNKTYNGLTVTTTTGTLTIASGKTATVNNSLTLAGTDSTTMTFPGTSSTVLTTGNTALIGIGYTVTPNNLTTLTSFTVSAAVGNYQYGTNNGAFTLTAPTSDCAVDILITNGASAGAITFSGFTVPAAPGNPFTTTNGNRFLLSIRRINSISTYSNYALQ